ncbi:MAG: pilus assembly protein TadG-related protein [Methylorubrum populi]
MLRIEKFRRLRKDEYGSLPVILAIALVPLAGLVGGVADFGRAISERTRLNSALDAAVIVAAKAAQDADTANKSSADVKSLAEKAGTDYFNSVQNLPAGTVPTVTVTVANRTVSVTGNYTAAVSTTLLGVLGIKSFSLTGNAASELSLSPMVDIYLLIDVSGSMAIGATTADIKKLQDKFGCAFACHDGASFSEGTGWRKTTYSDSFDWAQKNGVNLRINEINVGITAFVTWLKSQSSANRRLRIAVYSFSNGIAPIVKLTETLDSAANNLPSAPSASNTTEGGTHFSDIMPTFASIVGTSGDGTTTAKKLVIIATDGVQDPNRLWSLSGYEWMRPQVRPFDPADCRKVDRSVSVGVLYAPYINLSPDWGYLATLGMPSQIGNKGTRFDDIVPQLKQCATSAGLFVDASTSASVGDAFKNIFSSFTTVRLSR